MTAYNEFDPYGNPIVNTLTGTGRKSKIENPYGFTGEWWENDIDLLYLHARWYAPETGTFLSVDPVESEPDYLYVHGNPVNLTDASGAFPEWMLKVVYPQSLIDSWKLDKWWWETMLEAKHGDFLISQDKKRVAQFILDDPLYPYRWAGECFVPMTTITLEGFERDGSYWSSDSPITAEIWRRNTGSFYYTGLHPSNPTWKQFIQNEHPGLLAYMSNDQRFILGLYYGRIQLGTQSHIYQHLATGLDAIALAASVGTTIGIDTAGALIIAFGCSGGGPEGCLAGLGVVGDVDMAVSRITSFADLALGFQSFGATVFSDYFGGYTFYVNGRLRIGESTTHSFVTFAEGGIPETHILLYSNLKQFLYDIGFDSLIDIRDDYDIKAIEVNF